MSKVCKVCNTFKEFYIMHYKVCGQEFYYQGALTHTGEKPYKCGKTFRGKHHLEAHNLVHLISLPVNTYWREALQMSTMCENI